MTLRLSRIQRLVFPIISFRLSRWPFNHTRATQLDRVQRNMVGIVLNCQPSETESFDRFCRRKNRLISSQIPTKWSYVWASRVVSWHAHIVRNTCNNCWSARIASFRDAQELATRRANNSSGRPETRIQSGFASVRWYESVQLASRYIDAIDLRRV